MGRFSKANGLRSGLSKGKLRANTELKGVRRVLQSKPQSASSLRASGKGFEIRLDSDHYSASEYYTPLPQSFHVYFGKQSGHWCLYRSYDRVDNLCREQQFRLKSYFLNHIPKNVAESGDMVRINDYLSTMSVLRFEEERKTELKGSFGRGFRPAPRSNRCRRVIGSYLAAYAREQKEGQPNMVPNIQRSVDKIVAHQLSIISKLDSRAQESSDALLSELTEFVKANGELVANRLAAIGSPVDLQRRLRSLIPLKRGLAINLIPLRDITPTDMYSELIDLSTWFPLHFHVMRVCSEEPLNLVVINDTNKFVVREGKRTRLLRVRPTRFENGPQPTQFLATGDVRNGGFTALKLSEPPEHPPSIAAESGFSTVSMSTATTSPNSWQQWAMQQTHDEYEHRMVESTIANSNTTYRLGQNQFSQRWNLEIYNRLDGCIADMKRLREQVNLNARMDSIVIAATEAEREKAQPSNPGDLQWLISAEQRLQTLLSRPQTELTAEDFCDLKVLSYAKERYETRLSAYEETPVNQIEDKPDDEANVTRGLAINDGWINMLQAGRLDQTTLSTLRCLLSDGDSWLPDCGTSNLQLVSRCDRQSARQPVNADIFGRLSMTDEQAKILTIIALVFYIVSISLFWLVVLTDTKRDLDFKTCPTTDSYLQQWYPKTDQDVQDIRAVFGIHV
ncbi:hypothetical protein M3Y94_00749600 [Aphelenchoides besseyi]|nr:hypothetical protein M3Y94_00749600 [Aphelenchoides besseyi]KAI6232058.1 hypothetical protein M3Y95_00446900 [Aphelenchoides besseyi]